MTAGQYRPRGVVRRHDLSEDLSDLLTGHFVRSLRDRGYVEIESGEEKLQAYTFRVERLGPNQNRVSWRQPQDPLGQGVAEALRWLGA